MINKEGWQIGNIDVSLLLEKPKIAPYLNPMRETIAGILDIDINAISIKATTNEKMGYVGREEGVTSFAVALIYQ
jgi:2-C-methyl-D-erythritol 2,4-cyclodiphosphate synthase